mgnify:CR=1 FL=1
MIWTDRIRQVKIFLVIAAVFIAVASLVVSHFLVRDLAEEERTRMAVWAEAMRTLNNADENTDLNLVLKVINENNSIPVIVMDSENHAQTFRNVDVEGKDYAESLAYASAIGQRLLKQGKNIKIELDDSTHDYIQVCYDESLMIRRLSAYPYIQLGVVMLFVVIAIFALLTSKRAEQNKVWVGLSKETAHQLGTPISSLMAWIEILKMNYPDDELIPEMNKDIQRLQLIADRFSKIGALPEPVPASLNEVMNHVIDYMDRRTSKNVKMVKEIPEQDVIVKMNASLFEWVIENLSKNAVDAMGANGGQITLHVEETDDIKLLKECDAGVQMAISSIDEVLEKISDDQLKELLEESREHHEKLAKEIRHQLIAADSSGKEPNLMAKGMSWIKTNVMIEMSDRSTESVVADLITDGCNMGIKSLYRYQNQYSQAKHSAKEISRRLIDIEEQLRHDMQKYL